MPAMIVLKQTPRGMRLIPVTEVSGDRGRMMEASHPQAPRVRVVMDKLMLHARPMVKAGKRPTLAQLVELARAEGSFLGDSLADCKLLSSVGKTPARLLIKEATHG